MRSIAGRPGRAGPAPSACGVRLGRGIGPLKWLWQVEGVIRGCSYGATLGGPTRPPSEVFMVTGGAAPRAARRLRRRDSPSGLLLLASYPSDVASPGRCSLFRSQGNGFLLVGGFETRPYSGCPAPGFLFSPARYHLSGGAAPRPPRPHPPLRAGLSPRRGGGSRALGSHGDCPYTVGEGTARVIDASIVGRLG